MGKYHVAPITRRESGGHYIASVSIRSGRGRMRHDRVMRFVPRFDSHEQAARFAADQALAWIGAVAPTDSPSTIPQE